MSISGFDPRFPRYPVRYPQNIQIWQPTPQYPYPMNFVQAPSFSNQILIDYQGQPMLQGLSMVRGPVMFPIRNQIAYPRSHSTLSPLDRSYLSYQTRYNMRYC